MLRARELRLPEPLRLSDAAEVALEDYAREVTGSAGASALRAAQGDPAVAGLRLEGLAGEPPQEACRDIFAFARALAEAGEGAGLGWS
jgi:hypothetical protein